MCNLGGIVLLHTKKGWEVQEWKSGKAPEHEHFTWDMGKWVMDRDKTMQIYPKLKDFSIDSGLLIGARADFMSILPLYLLDGIVLMKGGEY